LLKAIERALARHRLALEEKAKSKSLHELVDTLTPREREVFELVVQGLMNKQIAHQLGTTVRTIKAHRRRIMEKIKARSLADLVVVAERLGIRADAKDAAATRTADHVVDGLLKDKTNICSC
jgi:FixJ family two-component response regulator